MKRFTLSLEADWHEGKIPFLVYVGEPNYYRSPLYYQRLWLQNFREMTIPSTIYSEFHDLFLRSCEDDTSCAELCAVVIDAAEEVELHPDLKAVLAGNVIDLAYVRDLTEKRLLESENLPKKPQMQHPYLHFGIAPFMGKETCFLTALCNQIFTTGKYGKEDYLLIFHLLLLSARSSMSQDGEYDAAVYRRNLYAYMLRHTDELHETIFYNVVVALDTIGFKLPVETLSYFEFFLNIHESARQTIFARALLQLNVWLDETSDTLSDNALVRQMLTEQTYLRIKNEFKTARDHAKA